MPRMALYHQINDYFEVFELFGCFFHCFSLFFSLSGIRYPVPDTGYPVFTGYLTPDTGYPAGYPVGDTIRPIPIPSNQLIFWVGHDLWRRRTTTNDKRQRTTTPLRITIPWVGMGRIVSPTGYPVSGVKYPVKTGYPVSGTGYRTGYRIVKKTVKNIEKNRKKAQILQNNH